MTGSLGRYKTPGQSMHHHSKLSRPLGAGFEQSTPPGTTMLACTTEAELQAADLPGTPCLRYAASMLLDLFRWLKRFADDNTVGPNRYVERLLYTTQPVLGGRIHGLYPTCLTLEKQDSTMHKCVALDTRVLTDETPYPDAPMTEPGFAYSYTVFFDRRRLQASHLLMCYVSNMLHHAKPLHMHITCYMAGCVTCCASSCTKIVLFCRWLGAFTTCADLGMMQTVASHMLHGSCESICVVPSARHACACLMTFGTSITA